MKVDAFKNCSMMAQSCFSKFIHIPFVYIADLNNMHMKIPNTSYLFCLSNSSEGTYKFMVCV